MTRFGPPPRDLPRTGANAPAAALLALALAVALLNNGCSSLAADTAIGIIL